MDNALKWVKLSKYVELTGDTSDAVHGRRRQGKWQDGVHAKVADGSLWINVPKAQEWVAQFGLASSKAVIA
jgi:hypothetical protein